MIEPNEGKEGKRKRKEDRIPISRPPSKKIIYDPK